MLGEKIKKARKAKKLTLVELGKLIGLTHAALSQIENEVAKPSRRTLISLAKELNTNFGDETLDEYLKADDTGKSKKEIADEMTVTEFVSLKFGGKSTRRSKQEIEMLTALLDAEIERIERDGF